MFNEINNLLKKSRNIDINSLPKISKTYTRFPPNQNEKSLIQIRDDPIINTKLKHLK